MNSKTRYLALAIEAIVYLLASLSLFTLVASMGNAIGSTVSVFPRMAPYYLSVTVLTYLLKDLGNTYHYRLNKSYIAVD